MFHTRVIHAGADRRVRTPRGLGIEWRNDRGSSSSLAMALLAPVMVVLMFLAWQAALWNHARTQARTIAQDTAVLVARSGLDSGSAERTARSALESDDDLQAVSVSVSSANGLVTVTVSANVPGVVRGTSSKISVSAVASIEQWAEL